jgi:hypothetical protein
VSLGAWQREGIAPTAVPSSDGAISQEAARSRGRGRPEMERVSSRHEEPALI